MVDLTKPVQVRCQDAGQDDRYLLVFSFLGSSIGVLSGKWSLVSQIVRFQLEIWASGCAIAGETCFVEKAVAPSRKGQRNKQPSCLVNLHSPPMAFARILQRTAFLRAQAPLAPFRNAFHSSSWQQKSSVVQWGYNSKKLNVFESNSVIPEVTPFQNSTYAPRTCIPRDKYAEYRTLDKLFTFRDQIRHGSLLVRLID